MLSLDFTYFSKIAINVVLWYTCADSIRCFSVAYIAAGKSGHIVPNCAHLGNKWNKTFPSNIFSIGRPIANILFLFDIAHLWHFENISLTGNIFYSYFWLLRVLLGRQTGSGYARALKRNRERERVREEQIYKESAIAET